MNYIQYMKPGSKFWALPNGQKDLSWSEFWNNWKKAITKAKEQIVDNWENLKQDYKDAADPIAASERKQAESIEATRAKQASMKFVSDNRTDHEKKRDRRNFELKEFEQKEQQNKDATDAVMWTLTGIPYAVQHLASPNGVVKTYGNTKAAVQNGGGPYLEKAVTSAAGDILDATILAAPLFTPEARLARAMNKNIRNTTLQPTVADEAVLRGQLGWAPKQTIPYRHGSKQADLKTFVPKHDRWDVVTHGADPNMYFVTDQSTPVSAANMMDLRPYQYTGSIVAEKPMVQVGDFNIAGKNATRNQLIARARQQGADAYLLQDIVDNKVPHQNVVARFIGPEGEAVQGGAASIKWYGPTMGKTTAAKTNPNLVDIDPLLKPIRAKHAERLGLKTSDPKVSSDPAYKQEVADFVLEWRANPKNQGKTLVASTKHLLDPQYKVEFANEPSIPDFETFAARNKARGFKETDEQLRAWYNSIFEQGRDLNIDNRFVLDIEGLAPNSHLQGDDAVRMFKEYGGEPIPQGSINGVQILAYIPEVRQRYGLVGNQNITDDEIAQALYKHIKELGGNTAAVNGQGEPQLLFRGSTSRHDKLIPKGTSEQLVSGADNILGNLFLGQMPYTVPGGDEGVGRYLGKMHGWMGPIPPQTKAAEVILPESKILAEDMYTLYTSKKFGDVKKLPGYAMSTGYNDINAFIVRTPSVRDATDEIVVLNPFETIPVDKRLGSTHSEHYRALIKDAELNNQGLIHSKPVLETRRNGTFGKYRDEHEYYDYFALPNFNIQNAKHILPYDFRIPRDWENPIIYRKQGGKLNYLNLMNHGNNNS